MATLLAEYSALLLAIYRQAQELSVHEFQDGVLNALKRSLDFDSSMWGTATMTPQGIDIHSLHLHNTTQGMIEDYAKVKHLDTSAVQVAAQARATIGFDSSRDFGGEEQAPLREFLHTHQHANFFITSEIHPITRFAQWISLYRNNPERICLAEETELLDCLAPHLMQALAINRLAHVDRLTKDIVREKWSVAIADTRGVLYHADQRFRELLALEWRSLDANKLPASLMRRLADENESQIATRSIVVHRSLERDLLYLKIRMREPVDELSPRELLVARLLMSGLTQKQVAAKLERSPETVRTQVRVIFDKLGINSVVMLGPQVVLRE